MDQEQHDGGALFFYSSTISRLRNCAFIRNRAYGGSTDGGAISFNCDGSGGVEDFSGNTFEGNYAGRHGGAFHSYLGTFGKIFGNKFLSSVADAYGGGMCLLAGNYGETAIFRFLLAIVRVLEMKHFTADEQTGLMVGGEVMKR